jgi:hypothetical protein
VCVDQRESRTEKSTKQIAHHFFLEINGQEMIDRLHSTFYFGGNQLQRKKKKKKKMPQFQLLVEAGCVDQNKTSFIT